MSVKKTEKKRSARVVKSTKKAAKKAVLKKTAAAPAKKEFIVKCIFMIHVRRIGWIRTALGGFLQYVSVFEFIFIHLTSIVVLYQWMLTPFFKLKKFRVKDYIIMDRGKIDNMVLFDRINCQFCGYANGTARLWNDQLDAVAASDLGKGKFFRKLISGFFALCVVIFLFFGFFFSKVLFLIIALFLGFHWADNKAVFTGIVKSGYAKRHNFVMKWILRCAKLYAHTLAANLEQIESQWCPLKHIEKRGLVVSDHHRNFYDRKKLDDMYKALETKGSVSPLKPKY